MRPLQTGRSRAGDRPVNPFTRPRLFAAAFTLAALAPTSAGAEIAPEARAVVERYVQAIGGREALAAVHALRLRGAITTMGLSGTHESWREMPDRTREAAVLGPYRLGGGFDGRTAWRVGPDGKLSQLDGKDLEDARAGAYFDDSGWLAADQAGGRVDYLGTRQDSTGQYTVLEVAPPVGHPRELWFDPASGLLARMVEPQNRPPVVSDLGDYRAFEGLRFPTRTVVHMVGMPANTLSSTLDSVTVNPPLPPGFFSPPDSGRSSVRYLKTPGRAEVALRYAEHLLWIRVSIDGAPPVDFLLDSGASISVVDSSYAASIGLKTAGDAQTNGAGASDAHRSRR